MNKQQEEWIEKKFVEVSTELKICIADNPEVHIREALIEAFQKGRESMAEEAAYFVTNWEGKIIPMIDEIRNLAKPSESEKS